MIARQKMSQIEWKTIEIRASKVGNVSPFSCPGDQVEHRTRFYKSSTLISRGVLRVQRSRWHSSGSADLSEQRVELDRRVLDFVVGLDTEINELVEGSELYSPKVDLDDVVLPAADKKKLCDLCEAFGYLAPYARKTGLFEHALPYGSGFIVLLCGPSGTGQGRKRVIQRRFNVGVLEAVSKRKASTL